MGLKELSSNLKHSGLLEIQLIVPLNQWKRLFYFSANIAFPNEDNGVFDEIVFTDLPREEAQAQLEKYNKVHFSFFPLLYPFPFYPFILCMLFRGL